LASVSHKLKTPIVCIDLMLQNLKTQFSLEKDIEENFISPAQKSCELLRCMVNNLVDFGKLESGVFETDFQEFSLRELIKESFDLFE
jgi:K+-sensing histidine kinase KdpD